MFDLLRLLLNRNRQSLAQHSHAHTVFRRAHVIGSALEGCEQRLHDRERPLVLNAGRVNSEYTLARTVRPVLSRLAWRSAFSALTTSGWVRARSSGTEIAFPGSRSNAMIGCSSVLSSDGLDGEAPGKWIFCRYASSRAGSLGWLTRFLAVFLAQYPRVAPGCDSEWTVCPGRGLRDRVRQRASRPEWSSASGMEVGASALEAARAAFVNGFLGSPALPILVSVQTRKLRRSLRYAHRTCLLSTISNSFSGTRPR
jgi:hypothetical protein